MSLRGGRENEKRRQWRVENSVCVIRLLDMRVYSFERYIERLFFFLLHRVFSAIINGSPALVILYWCLSSSFLIFYVGNSTSVTCVSIFSFVIVRCVMMSFKMNVKLTKIPCRNTIFFI